MTITTRRGLLGAGGVALVAAAVYALFGRKVRTENLMCGALLGWLLARSTDSCALITSRSALRL